MIGITGELKGQVIMAFEFNKALDVASKMMMGMQVTALDDMSISAISELGNMIMGNAATIFSTKGYVIDITPPSVCHGDMTITQSYTQNICVPIHSGDEVALELNIAVIAEQ
jgi:chemotaxis protein cheX